MLKGRTAVITGSTSGIGLGIARALAKEGASIMLNGFGEVAEIERIRAGIASTCGVRVLHSPADMTKPAEIRAMMQFAAKELGGVSINGAALALAMDGGWTAT